MNTMFDFLDRIQVQKEPGPGAISRRRWTHLLRKMSYAGSMSDHI